MLEKYLADLMLSGCQATSGIDSAVHEDLTPGFVVKQAASDRAVNGSRSERAACGDLGGPHARFSDFEFGYRLLHKAAAALFLQAMAVAADDNDVAVTVGVSRSTVGEYLRRAGVIGFTWPVPEGLDDGEQERRLFRPPTFD